MDTIRLRTLIYTFLRYLVVNGFNVESIRLFIEDDKGCLHLVNCELDFFKLDLEE